jgi:hypothetical protein
MTEPGCARGPEGYIELPSSSRISRSGACST